MSDELAEAKQLIKTLQGQVSSLQYTKHHDYKFLVEENRRLEQELNEAKADNKKLAQQIDNMVDKLRDSNF
jgi:predicted  nucleic acid-binding Zn-ribbon protein